MNTNGDGETQNSRESSIVFHTVFSPLGQLDMPKENILANLQTILIDVCSHRPANLGMFTKTHHSALHFNCCHKMTSGLLFLSKLQIDSVSNCFDSSSGFIAQKRKSFQNVPAFLCCFDSLVQFTSLQPD